MGEPETCTNFKAPSSLMKCAQQRRSTIMIKTLRDLNNYLKDGVKSEIIDQALLKFKLEDLRMIITHLFGTLDRHYNLTFLYEEKEEQCWSKYRDFLKHFSIFDECFQMRTKDNITYVKVSKNMDAELSDKIQEFAKSEMYNYNHKTKYLR